MERLVVSRESKFRLKSGFSFNVLTIVVVLKVSSLIMWFHIVDVLRFKALPLHNERRR